MFCFKRNILKKVGNPKLLLKLYGTETITKTSLYNLHKKFKGKLINFGGYYLPVSYADQTIAASHIHTRQHASVFDVSHMLQTYIRGKNAIGCFEGLCTADIHGLSIGTACLTVFTNSLGGILDDLIVTKIDEKTLYIVSNAAMKKQDKLIMQGAVEEFKLNGKDVHIEFLDSNDRSLLALQGPSAKNVLTKCIPKAFKLDELFFMRSATTDVVGVPNCRITRCGYTGEDGFEISMPSDSADKITESILSAASYKICRLAGLGARDSLRLEAGLCLYGSDIDSQTTPAEAALGWLVASRRRREMNFPGADHICKQLLRKEKLLRSRVGIISDNSPPARAQTPIYFRGAKIGQITSGCPSPCLKQNIAMGYVRKDLSTPGTLVQLQIRNKLYDGKITRMPFVKPNYYLNSQK